MIREATLQDVSQLVDMGKKFLASTVYARFLTENADQMRTLAEGLINSDRGGVWVSEGQDGRLNAMIGVQLVVHLFSGELTAGELFWWSSSPSRGIRVLERAELWARQRGARKMTMGAPVGLSSGTGARDIYRRYGFMPVEESFQKELEPMPARVLVLDDVLPDPETYRAKALEQSFGDIEAAPGVVFHGMCSVGPSPLSEGLEAQLGLKTTYSAFRLSPQGQEEPNFIHSDLDMGEFSGILYLNPAPVVGDGTVFYRHRVTGAIESTAKTEAEKHAEWAAWRDVSQWEPWHTVVAKFNRLVLFPSAYFHSRALFENWGEGSEARLIQLVFGAGTLPTMAMETV